MNGNATMKPAPEIEADKFKDQCLTILDELDPAGFVITKQGRPIARLIPYPMRPEDLIGCLKRKIRFHGDLFSTGERWNAAEGKLD